MDINQAPKQFCDNIVAGYSSEYFVLVLKNGNSATAYSISPAHAKRLAQYMTYQVEQFEKENGEIKAAWTPNITSPIQPGDLKNPGTDPKGGNDSK